VNQASNSAPICVTCGTQFPPSSQTPSHCPICEDERQFVGWNGQEWTTLINLQGSHSNRFIAMEPGVTAILTEPAFAIGQRAFLIESAAGNVLWDCVTLLDQPTIGEIRRRGGLSAIAISHPHYYSTMVEWAETFNVPVLLHAADRQWVMRPHECIRFWEEDRLPLHDGMTLIRAGGHFDGGALLHVPAAADRKGALFSGDIIQVVPDRRWVSFMYSYPNLLPLSEKEVRRIVTSVKSYRFERVYGAFHPRQVVCNGEEVIRKSADRYIKFLLGADG
jgi:hypothetical protein